ncbi:hypothetical protein QMK54_17655 [Pseudomonas sp. P5_109]|uniref:hypothetical protein n=1 Tax=Pseudomonas sp. P5_109 TaxID=3043441 RepID=UPI002A35DCFF|nr:hypothetical protein [Pseudomonas sp. P5_109]WPN27665.1 hypothetical protein QMK54_17655 [Pseudomonas sp. P5_109]
MQPIQFFAARAEDGALLPGATINVYISGTSTLANLYSDENTYVPLANPAYADANAGVFFYTKERKIDVAISRGGYVAPLLRGIVTTDPGDVLNAAVSAADRAEAARDAAQLSSGIYPNTSAGISNTASGRYFSVPSPEWSQSLILYLNNGGVPLEIKRYPSSAILDIARRSNYQLSGRTTKVEKGALSLDFTVSWGRLYIFTGTGKARANVQAVTDLVVPDGKCAYVDLAEPLVGGEYLVHVSSLPLTAIANPPGSYIEDSKIILFTCLNGVVGGALYPQYHSVGDGVVSRAALTGALQNTLDRAGWHVVGRATKLQRNVGTPSTYSISFSELTVTGGLTFSSKKVAPVSGQNVPFGEAIYVDLDSAPNESGQLVPQVTTGGFTAGMLASGAFVTDRKVYLLINGTSGLGGPLARQEASVDSIDQTLKNRTVRAAYQVIGDISRFLLSGTACVMSFGDLRVARGVGNTTLVIAGLTDVTVPLGQALYVDLGAELVGGKLVAEVTTAGYSSVGGSIASGAFVDDNKLYLFINDGAGYGGALANRRPLNTYLGEVWLKQAPINITFDPTTRTLAWDNYLILPTNSGQGRIKITPGSFSFTSTGFNVAYLDLSAAVTTGDTPATAVKGGVYYESPSPDRFRGLPNQLPMFYWNGANDFGSLCGFPRASEPGATVVSTLAPDDVVVKVGATLVSTFIKGSKATSKKYLEFTLGYEYKPFDPTGADAYGNADLWRLKHAYEADLDPVAISFVRSRSGKALLNGGEITCAIKEQGAPDYIGGFHGDEVKSTAILLLDGVEIPMGTVATYVGKKLQYVQRSTLFKCNTQTAVATRSQSLVLSHESGHAKIDMSQKVVWSQSLVLEAAMLTMLPIKRLLDDSTGEVITNTALRSPYVGKEDVSVEGFPQIATLGWLPDSQIWGPTGISASVQILKHPGYADCGFYVANAPYYNKDYYSVAGSAVSTMGGVTHTTQPGETWNVDSVIKMTTNL